MKIGSGYSRKFIGLTLLAVVLLSAYAYAKPRDWKWWKRGPVPAVENVEFSQTSVRDGRVRNIIVERDGQIKLRSKLVLKDTNIVASVLDGVLTIDPISQNRGIVNLDIELNPATLQRNVFNSSFTTNGTAIISTEDANVTVPVNVFGTITPRRGQYLLKAEIRGLAGVDSPVARILRVRLLAEADIPRPSDLVEVEEVVVTP